MASTVRVVAQRHGALPADPDPAAIRFVGCAMCGPRVRAKGSRPARSSRMPMIGNLALPDCESGAKRTYVRVVVLAAGCQLVRAAASARRHSVLRKVGVCLCCSPKGGCLPLGVCLCLPLLFPKSWVSASVRKVGVCLCAVPRKVGVCLRSVPRKVGVCLCLERWVSASACSSPTAQDLAVDQPGVFSPVLQPALTVETARSPKFP